MEGAMEFCRISRTAGLTDRVDPTMCRLGSSGCVLTVKLFKVDAGSLGCGCELSDLEGGVCLSVSLSLPPHLRCQNFLHPNEQHGLLQHGRGFCGTRRGPLFKIN